MAKTDVKCVREGFRLCFYRGDNRIASLWAEHLGEKATEEILTTLERIFNGKISKPKLNSPEKEPIKKNPYSS